MSELIISHASINTSYTERKPDDELIITMPFSGISSKSRFDATRQIAYVRVQKTKYYLRLTIYARWLLVTVFDSPTPALAIFTFDERKTRRKQSDFNRRRSFRDVKYWEGGREFSAANNARSASSLTHTTLAVLSTANE